jgi:hypothetical protein
MPCVCQRCLEHSRTLGLEQTAPSGDLIRKAFRAAAKLWHPDRFENDPRAQKAAEEHFKQIQVAYRELWEHNETPREWPVETPREQPVENPFAQSKRVVERPAIAFGGAPGCFTGPDFPFYTQQVIVDHLGNPEDALAFIDLSAGKAQEEALSQYVLFTVHGFFVRDARKIVSLLWYSDLEDVKLTERRGYGKLGLWRRLKERLYGVQPRYSLLIYGRNRTLFCRFDIQMDDSVKKVVYNFLLRRKSEAGA